jgi:hypothetical protein
MSETSNESANAIIPQTEKECLMDKRTVNTETPSAAEIAAVDAQLAELDLESFTSDPAIVELDPADEAAVELVEAKSEHYEAAPVSASGIEPEATPEAPAAEKTRKAGAPRTPRDLNAIDAKHFELTIGSTVDPEANKAAVIALLPKQKKIAEKFENLFQSIAAGKKPSVYAMVCFEALEKAGTVTQADLVAALRAASKRSGASYSEGTARSQAGQIMNLFDTVKIATRTKQTLERNPNSQVAAALRGIAAA